MKRIRIGKDISMRWEITTDGVAIPLDGRDLTVEIKSPAGIENNIPYRIDGNILIMTYYGYEQKRTGEYSITLWEKKGKPGQNVVDVIRAFELVRTSQEENDFVGGDLQIESVDLGTENFDILTEGGYRAINIDTLQAEALEDSVNIKGKTYSNESFTITLPKANLDSAGVMSADDKHTLQEHGNRIAQINTTLDEHTESINARITTDRIADGAVTTEKIATTAFDSTLSVSGKIAPADVVGRKLTDLEDVITFNADAFIKASADFSKEKLYAPSAHKGYYFLATEIENGDVLEFVTFGATSVQTFAITDKELNFTYVHSAGSLVNFRYNVTNEGFVCVKSLVAGGEPQLIIYRKKTLSIANRTNFNLFDNNSVENEDGVIYVNGQPSPVASYFTSHFFKTKGKVKICGMKNATRIHALVDGAYVQVSTVTPTNEIVEFVLPEEYKEFPISFYALKEEKMIISVTDESTPKTIIDNDVFIHESQIIKEESAKPTDTEYIYESICYEDVEHQSGLVNKDGTISDNSRCEVTAPISVSEGDKIWFSLYNLDGYPCIAAYSNANGTVYLQDSSVIIASEVSGKREFKGGEYIVPKGVKSVILSSYWNPTSDRPADYFRFTVLRKIENTIGEIDGKHLNGKKWVAFGTSITDNIATNPNDTPNVTGRYYKYLLKKSRMLGINLAKHGSALRSDMLQIITNSFTNLNSFKPTYDACVKDADLITIEGFVNDFASNFPIGTITDTTSATLCGSMYQAVLYLRTNFANATIVFITDSSGKVYGTADLSINKLSNNKTQSEYNEGIVKMAKHLGCYVIDAGAESGINSLSPQYIVDQIHHNEEGGRLFAETIWAQLKNIPLKEQNKNLNLYSNS